MKIADVIIYEGDNTTFVWKSDCVNFNTHSQLIVHESQEAIFFNNGQALDLFSAGRYTLTTQNLPILGKLQRIPTDGKTPFHCEVYFINKTEQMAIKWGTGKIQYLDQTYGFPISIGASGEISLTVADSRKLLIKLIGTETELSQEKLTSYFRGILMTHIKTFIGQTIKENKVSIFEIDEILDLISDVIKEKIQPIFSDYGISVEKLSVTNIAKPDGEEQYERFKRIFFEESIGIREEKLRQQKELIRQQTASQKIIMESQALATKRIQEGYTYTNERAYDVAQGLAENEGVGAFSNAGIGLGMMTSVSREMGAAVAGLATQEINPITSKIPQPNDNENNMPKKEFADSDIISFTKEDIKNVNITNTTQHDKQNAEINANTKIAEFKQKVDMLMMMRNAGALTNEEFVEQKKELLKIINNFSI